MKKLIEKDKKSRSNVLNYELKITILQSIYQNLNFPVLIRWNSSQKLHFLVSSSDRAVSLSKRCVESVNKKNFTRSAKFSRHLYLKMLRFGEVYGIQKASW